MKEINTDQIHRTNFKGIKRVNKEEKTLDSCIDLYTKKLLARAEREVPEYGEFTPVYEQFANPDKSLSATDFMLKIAKPPKTIQGHEKIRNLTVVAYRLPLPYKAERIIATGNKDDILKELQSPEVFDKIRQAANSLSYNLEDV